MSNDGAGLRDRLIAAADEAMDSGYETADSRLLREAATALSAVAPPPVLEGWVLVPREPTIAMFRGMVEWAEGGGSEEVTDEYLAANLPDFTIGYAAMLAASPAAPAQQAVNPVQWLRDNYHAFPNIESLCDAMTTALASNAAASAADAQEGK